MNYEKITSRNNRKIISACALKDKKYRDSTNSFFFEGAKLLKEALSAKLNINQVFFTEKAYEKYHELIDAAEAEKYAVDDAVYEKLTDEQAPQGIFTTAQKVTFLEDLSQDLSLGYVILEGIQNPSNLGTVVRTAFALGAKKILIDKNCADPFGPKAVRAGMGAIFKAEISFTPNLPEAVIKLRENGFKVYAAALTDTAKEIDKVNLSESDCIILGNEGNGLTEETVSASTCPVIIPMSQGAESLNAASAATILIWEKQKGRITK